MNSVTVRIPGTTANLGSGFDTLGLAIALHNKAQLARRTGRGPLITSPISDDARDGATALFRSSAQAFFRRTRIPAFGFEIHLEGAVPIARGLGSSVTARLGCIAGLNALTGSTLDRHALLDLVSAEEGHPDNAAPAVFGGFTAAGFVGKEVRCIRTPIQNSIRFITLIPPFEVSTPEARQLVPLSFSKADTIHSLNRTALITAAFTSGNYTALQGCFDDRIHQPWRAKLIPQLDAVISAGVKAGAIGGWLSGSGSTLMCLATKGADTEAIATAMLRRLPGSAVYVLKPDNDGVQVSV